MKEIKIRKHGLALLTFFLFKDEIKILHWSLQNILNSDKLKLRSTLSFSLLLLAGIQGTE